MQVDMVAEECSEGSRRLSAAYLARAVSYLGVLRMNNKKLRERTSSRRKPWRWLASVVIGICIQVATVIGPVEVRTGYRIAQRRLKAPKRHP